jgi:hypothetical protein
MPLSKITNPFLGTPNTRISSNSANTINVSVGATNPSVTIKGFYNGDASNNAVMVGINNANPTRQLDISGTSGGTAAEMNFTQPGTVRANGKVWNVLVDGGGVSANANFTIRRLTDDGTTDPGGYGFSLNGNTGIFTTNTARKISPASVPAGSVIQTKWVDLSGTPTYQATTATAANTGYAAGFTPQYSTSYIVHIVTIGLYFVCDGQIRIYRNGSSASPSLAGTARAFAYGEGEWINDHDVSTFTWLDGGAATTSPITYSLWASAGGCGNVVKVGTSGDFTPSWLMMEIAV